MERPDSPTRTLYDRMSADILGGAFGPQDRLSEIALSERYGVSRTPVREALVRLEQDGVIDRNGATARLRVRTVDEIHDIYRARAWLEQAIAEDAARRRGEPDLIRVRDALDRATRLDPQDASPAQLMSANRFFHSALALAAHNTTLLDLQTRLTAQVSQLPETTLSVPGRWEVAHRQHLEIFEQVSAGNADEAGALARQHLEDARDIRLTLAIRAAAEETDDWRSPYTPGGSARG